ncbi:MAG: S41 family peptidase [Bacteroidota bacterium]
MKVYRPLRFILPILLITLTACPWDPDKPNLPEEVQVLNHWIWQGMSDVYLWERHLPDLDPDYQEDPEAYFYDLLYTEDHYSWIVEDSKELTAMFDGIERSTGISARPGLLTETKVISIVEYVSSDSPAEDSAIKRGDIIIAIDGQSLTAENYYDLFLQEVATFEFGDWNGTGVVPNGREITLRAIQLNQNPVIHSEVIDFQGTKTGYLVYTQFTSGKDGEWLEELNRVFQDFNTAGVSDVVVDLRYNRGGSLDLSAYIASTLAPKSAMQGGQTYVNLVWNDGYNQFWKDFDMDGDGTPDGENSTQLVIKLPASEMNMDLSSVYFLTTDNTASASESLMTGLYPYMDVIQIGTTTYGKCYGSVTIEDWDDPKRHNWAMQPIVLKYSNANGFTDFVNGIDPDFEVEDRLLEAKPFGSLEDPVLGKALEEITGVNPSLKAAKVPYEGFDVMPVQKNKMVERRISLPDVF